MTSSRPMTASAAAALTVVCLLWGINVVMMKVSTGGFPPALTAGLRNLVAALVYVPVLLRLGQPVFHRDSRVLHGAVIGLLFACDFFFMYTGLRYTNASRAVIFIYTHPVWVALGAHFLFRDDRLSWRKVFGLALALGGIATVFGTRAEELPQAYWLGDLMQVVSAMFWAATTLYIKKMSERVQMTAVHILFYQLLFSVPVLLVLSALLESGFPIKLTSAVVLALLYQTFIVAVASYLVWYWMITVYRVTNLVVFTMLTPLFGVLAGVLLRNEILTPWLVLGLILVLSGIYFVSLSQKPKVREKKTGAAGLPSG